MIVLLVIMGSNTNVSCAYLRVAEFVTLGFRHYIQMGQQCVKEKYTNINKCNECKRDICKLQSFIQLLNSLGYI